MAEAPVLVAGDRLRKSCHGGDAVIACRTPPADQTSQTNRDQTSPERGWLPLAVGGVCLSLLLLAPSSVWGEPAIQQGMADAAQESGDTLPWREMVLGLLTGLVLLLYGVEQLARGLHQLAGQRLQAWLGRFTKNHFLGVISGIVVTTALDSSSVTIIMMIAMIAAGILTFEQSLGVVLGANIGTALGVQIIAFEIYDIAPVLMVVGLLAALIGRTDRTQQLGKISLGFGLLLFGLDYMGETMEPLNGSPTALRWLQELGQEPVLGAGVGGLMTVLIQSSSATVAIAVRMADEGLLPLSSGVAIMLGAELGTVSNTVVATIGRTRAAVRTALFHLLFNLTTVIVGLLVMGSLMDLAIWITPGEGNIDRQLANAQLLFNVLGVLAFIWFVPWIAQGLYWLVPGPPPTADPELASTDGRLVPPAEQLSDADGSQADADFSDPSPPRRSPEEETSVE